MANLIRLARPLAAAAVLFALGAAAAAQSPVRIGYFDKDRAPFATGASTFCAKLAQRTSGRYRCDNVGESLGTPAELLEALRQGKVDAVNLPVEALEPVLPDLAVFNVPFLFRSENHARNAVDGYIGHGLLAKLQGHGLVGLAWTETGMRHMTNNLRPIVSAADVRGLRMRVQDQPLQLLGMRTLQIDPRPMAFPLVYDALAAGQLDGEENLIPVIVDANFARVQKHLSLTGHLYSPGLLLVSQALWDKVPPADRPRFVEAAKAGATAQRRQVTREATRGLQVLKRNGVRIVDKVDRESFRIASAPAYAEYAKTFGADWLASIQAVK